MTTIKDVYYDIKENIDYLAVKIISSAFSGKKNVYCEIPSINNRPTTIIKCTSVEAQWEAIFSNNSDLDKFLHGYSKVDIKF